MANKKTLVYTRTEKTILKCIKNYSTMSIERHKSLLGLQPCNEIHQNPFCMANKSPILPIKWKVKQTDFLSEMSFFL